VAAKGRRAGSADDRRHPPQGSPHGGQPAQKGAVPRHIGRTKGGLNSQLPAGCDGRGRPLILLLSQRRMSDYQRAALMIDAFPKANTLIGDKGCNADGLRQAVIDRCAHTFMSAICIAATVIFGSDQ
jgi:hypothetical protein